MRYCLAPRCPVLVERGYCKAHYRAQEATRGSQRDRGYTRRWERLAAAFRERYPLCGQRPGNLAPVLSECYETGRVTVARVVDHVIPHKGDPALMWDEATNWQSLCVSCHAKKTAAGQ